MTDTTTQAVAKLQEMVRYHDLRASTGAVVEMLYLLATERDALAAQLAAAEASAREASLDALAAYGQAADAHAAQLAAEKSRDEWRNDLRALEAAIVGDTGLSAMLVATQARLFKPRAEAAEQRLATARGEALEEAARYHDKCEADEIAVSAKYRGGSNPWFAHVQSAKWHANDAAAIRALAKGES